MRKRIEELAEGKIPYEQPRVVFSKEKLELEVVEGQTVTDSFQVKSENGIQMRGIIYASSARMECLTFQFEGEEAQIQVRGRFLFLAVSPEAETLAAAFTKSL